MSFKTLLSNALMNAKDFFVEEAKKYLENPCDRAMYATNTKTTEAASRTFRNS